MQKTKILAIDFDNTIRHLNSYPDDWTRTFGNKIVERYVRKMYNKGWYIIINTARHDEGLEKAVEYLKKYNIPFHAVNENNPLLCSMFGDTRKIFCDLSLDDTQIGFVGWLLRTFC